MIPIENKIQDAFNKPDNEKTFIDKLLARDDIKTIKRLMKKQDLTREELLELLYMLASSESKLHMLLPYERYVLLKFFVWIREMIKIAEIYFDFKEDVDKKLKEKTWVLSPRALKALNEVGRYIEHNAKFVVDLWLMIARTSLSLGGSAFIELLKQRFEVQYSTKGETNTPQNQMSQ